MAKKQTKAQKRKTRQAQKRAQLVARQGTDRPHGSPMTARERTGAGDVRVTHANGKKARHPDDGRTYDFGVVAAAMNNA